MSFIMLFLTACSSDDEAPVVNQDPYVPPPILGIVEVGGDEFKLNMGTIGLWEEHYWVVSLETLNWMSRDDGAHVDFVFYSSDDQRLESGTYAVDPELESPLTVIVLEQFPAGYFDTVNGDVTVAEDNGIYTISWKVRGYFWGGGFLYTSSGNFIGHLLPGP
ncbi:hypothetical protein GCM10010465_22490 [Actinomadura fibrosa]